MIVLIDNGHGSDTKGKCSPDGQYREYRFAREIASAIRQRLTVLGYDARLLVPEETDVPLAERVRRVNEVCGRYGADNVILISIHSNASGTGEWMPANGWSAYTSKGKTKADALATLIYNEAVKNFVGRKVRTYYSDGDPDWEEGFYILRKTKCPAVLTENFFHDNREDIAFMTSPAGREAIVSTHVDGIVNYIKSLHHASR